MGIMPIEKNLEALGLDDYKKFGEAIKEGNIGLYDEIVSRNT